MSDQIDDLIKEIAAKHHVAVGRDDPILILYTLNARLIRDSQKAQEEIFERYQQEIEKTALQWEIEAKAKAERILNAALAASREATQKLMQESAASMAVLMGKEVQSALTQIDSPLRETKKVAIFNIAAGVVTLLASLVVLYMVFRHLPGL